ncbi:MAG TPA: hypothetical protein VGH51_17595 [Candidatus Angelobacter sp.]
MDKLRRKKWLGALLGSGALLTAVLLAYGHYLRWEARSVLEDVKVFISAPNHDAAFAALSQKYGNRLKPSKGCSADQCSYELTVSNQLLSTLLRSPRAELNARFDLMRKSVVLVMVDYRSAQSNQISPVIHVQADVCDRCDWFYVHPWNQSSTSERWNGIVEMGVAIAPELRDAALGLNPDCLTRLRGCTDIAQLLPSIWEVSAPGVRCVVPNHSGQAR